MRKSVGCKDRTIDLLFYSNFTQLELRADTFQHFLSTNHVFKQEDFLYIVSLIFL